MVDQLRFIILSTRFNKYGQNKTIKSYVKAFYAQDRLFKNTLP